MELVTNKKIAEILHNEKQVNNITEGVVPDPPEKLEEFNQPHTFISSEQHSNNTLEYLSERWSISVAQAKLTLEATTQRPRRLEVIPLSRRYRDDRIFGVKRLDCIMATDTMQAKEQLGPRKEFQAIIRKYGINGHLSDRERSNQNPAEGVIRELRKWRYQELFRTYCPRKLWRY